MKPVLLFAVSFFILSACSNGNNQANDREDEQMEESSESVEQDEQLAEKITDSMVMEPSGEIEPLNEEEPAAGESEDETGEPPQTTQPEQEAKTKTPEAPGKKQADEPEEDKSKNHVSQKDQNMDPEQTAPEKEVTKMVTYNLQKGQLRIEGTSTMHDWEMAAQEFTVKAVMILMDNGTLKEVKSLDLTLPVKNLKSDEKKLNKLAWEALKSDDHPNITYTLTSTDISEQGTGTYAISSRGKLTIAGVTRNTSVIAKGKAGSGNTITFSGTKVINMTDYDVEPPSLMLGAMKTGEEITLHFNVVMIP